MGFNAQAHCVHTYIVIIAKINPHYGTLKSRTCSSPECMYKCLCSHTFLCLLFPQKGDSAVIIATVGHESGALRELVRAGAALNLQNEVRYTVTVDTALRHVSSPAVRIRRV